MRDWIGFNKWLRASSHEPSWLGWLVNQDKFCLGFMWEISIGVLKWEKGLKTFLAWFLRSYREKLRSQDPRPDHLFILTHQDFLRELGMRWDIENQACLINGAHMKRLYWLVKPNYQTPLSHITPWFKPLTNEKLLLHWLNKWPMHKGKHWKNYVWHANMDIWSVVTS